MKPAWSLFVGLLLLVGTPILPLPFERNTTEPSRPTVSPEKATAAIYVYEKDESAIPTGVTSGINRLNREKKILASLFEKDSTDGTGKTPDQYKPALDAAKASSIPSLVVLSGSAVLKVVKSPKSESEVFEAVK